jgi:glycosyltransferase involved in cell wall biosynthesis
MAHALRVLHVSAGNLWGGIENFLVTLARHAGATPDIQAEFTVCFDGRLKRELERANAPVLDLGPVRARAPWSIRRARGVLARHLRQRHFDLVVCHSAWAQAMFGSVPPALGAPLVFYLHDLVRPKFWLERWARRHPPTWCVTNSEFTRSSLRELFPSTESSVVYYPIEGKQAPLSDHERRALRAELGADDRTVLIVQASRMEPWKGHARLLRALARITPTANWLCLQVGGAQRRHEQRYQERLEAEARALGVTSRVRWLGQRDDVPRLLAACDIHCQANAEPEPFGIVFVEALHAGLPTVTFDLGGPREIVTPEVGFLVQDEAELATTLERLVLDPDLRRRLGAAGPARARALCDPAAQVSELGAVFRRVAGLREGVG